MTPSPERPPLRILHTAAHPADAFDMAGGTLAHHVRRGDQLAVLVFTHGARSHAFDAVKDVRLYGANADVDAAMERKNREVIDACAVLGIEDVRFLGHDEPRLAGFQTQVKRTFSVESGPHRACPGGAKADECS